MRSPSSISSSSRIRRFTVVSLVGMAVAVAAGAAFLVFSSNPDTPPSGAAMPVVAPEETNTPVATQTKSPETATSTPVPVPTEATPGPGSHGKYETIDQLPIDESKKRAIRELTKDSIPFIITDNGMIVIQHSMVNRPGTIQYYEETLTVSQLHAIFLNTAKYPNAQDAFDTSLEMAKYEAWKNQSGSGAAFEDYRSSRNSAQLKFEVWGYNGTSDELGFHALDDDAFIIIKYLGGIDRTNIIWSHGVEMSNEVLGNVVSVGMFTVHPSGEGFTDNSGVDLDNYYCAAEIAASLASLGAAVNDNIVGGKFSLAGQTTGDGKLQASLNNLTQALLPQFEGNPNPPSTEGWEAIFTVNGTSYKIN